MGKNEFCNDICELARSCDAPSELLDVTVSSENVCLEALEEVTRSPNVFAAKRASYMMEGAIRSQDKKLMRAAIGKFYSLRSETGDRVLKPGLFLAAAPAFRARLERRAPNDDEIEQTATRMSRYLCRATSEYLTLLNTDQRQRRGATQGAIGEAAVVYLSFLNRSITGEGSLIYPSFIRERDKANEFAHHCHTIEPDGDRRLFEVTTRTGHESAPGKIALRELCKPAFENDGSSAELAGNFTKIIGMLPLLNPIDRQIDFGLDLADEIQDVVDRTPITPSTY